MALRGAADYEVTKDNFQEKGEEINVLATIT
jgi:hypothetical protein